MNASLQKVTIPEGRRMIAVSDLHGNLDGFRRILKKVNFSAEDILIIVGDILEKGPDSLGLLREVMRLSKTYSVYAVCGNCDDLYEEVLSAGNPESDWELLNYMLRREHSILNEMCREIGFSVCELTDMNALKRRLPDRFQAEFQFLKELPVILETQKFVFVHAALQSDDLEHQEKDCCMSTDAFMDQGLKFGKYCVVGHWPVCLYNDEIMCHNPIIDRKNKIISIDGGNVLKESGQINALILRDTDPEDIQYETYDDLPTGIALDSQKASDEETFYIHWTDGEVEVLEKKEEFSLCRHVSSGKQIWVWNQWLFQKNGKLCSDDCTDACLRIEPGDAVSVIADTSRGYFIKKDGVCGWYGGRLAGPDVGSGKVSEKR
jgi:Predicted phosphoesterases, related to the Icc protein